MIAKFRVPAFVATLATMGIIQGIIYITTQSRIVTIEEYPNFNLLNTTRVLGFLPVPFLIALGFLAVLWVVFRHTPFGRHVAAVGGNPVAAAASGINVRRLTIAIFVLIGFLSAISGIMSLSQLMAADPTGGGDFTLKVMAVAVLGGASISGGRANLLGTLVASMLIAAVNSSLNMFGLDMVYQWVALGILLTLAVSLDAVRRITLPNIAASREIRGAK